MAFSVLSVQAATSMLDMSLEELLDVRIHTATLSGSEMRKVPATITTITSEEIKESGSRNLNELLEVYVPNMLYLRHNWESSHIGMRGVIGDVDNKYLILVNGKVMNNLVHAGAISERDLAMLGDIKEIRVVRGPGSVVYGAGALIGVVDIQTFSGANFTGTEVTLKAGAIEEFYTAEFKSGFKLNDNAHLLLYGGISELAGADSDAAPYVMSVSGKTFNGTPITAGKPYPVALREDRQSYRGLPPLKFHGELTVGDLSIWARYTRGGEVQDPDQLWLIRNPYGFAYKPPTALQAHEIGYQQFSLGADYKHTITKQWELAYRVGYDMHDFERREFDGLLDANREDKYSARALATWTSSETHALTFGAEFLHAEFGLPSPGYPDQHALSAAWSDGRMPRWNTDTYSLLGEDCWDITPKWSLTAGLRIDKNDYTDFMFSPRGALVYTPSKKDVIKLMLSQAVKANVAEELRLQHENTGEQGDTETLRAAELSYTRLVGEKISLGANVFFNNFNIIGWDERTKPVGEADIAGLELEANYHSGSFRMGASHSYSKLVDFRNGTPGQAITAQPYGFGHDLNHWSSHITKLHFAYQPIDKLQFFGALRIFWGWPGYEDFSNYANATRVDSAGDPLTFLRDPKYNPYDSIQARLNLGVTYNVTKSFSASVHGYNLLGLFDGHLNDRFIMFSSSARQDAPAVAVSLSYKF